jgi:hypothetical protein
LLASVALQRLRGLSRSAAGFVGVPCSLGLSSGFRFLLLLFVPG